MSEMIATANATRACAKNPPDTGYPVSGGSVILRLYGGSAQRLLFGERLVPDLNGLELGHPAVRFKLAFPCIQQTLLHAPLSGLGLLGIGDVCKGGLCGGFGLALLSPDEQCQLAAVCRDGRALRAAGRAGSRGWRSRSRPRWLHRPRPRRQWCHLWYPWVQVLRRSLHQ